MPATNRLSRAVEGAVLVSTCALVLSTPRLADACGASLPELFETVPVTGATYPGNAALLFWGESLTSDALTVTVDGAPATLQPAEFAATFANLALVIEPTPQAGQTVVVAGKVCEEATNCEAAFTYTASAPDTTAPAPMPEASLFAVFDHQDFDFTSGCDQFIVEETIYVHLQQAAPAAGEAISLFTVTWEPTEGVEASGLRRTVRVPEPMTLVTFALDSRGLGDADVMTDVCLEVVAIDSAGNAAAPFELCPPCFARADETPVASTSSLPPEPLWTEADAVPGSACAPATGTTGEEETGGESGEAPTTGGETGETPTTGEETGEETGAGTDSATGGEDDGEKGCACRSDGSGGGLGHLLLVALGLGLGRRRR